MCILIFVLFVICYMYILTTLEYIGFLTEYVIHN